MAAFSRAGFTAVGLEPSAQARDTARELSERIEVELEIVPGFAEHLPFESESFDFVNAYSVIEHVDNPEAVFNEVSRVLKPGGGFFFFTTSRLSPFQNEIGRFPLFPWYPQRFRNSIMTWAKDNRPALVGHTTRPAVHWFSHGDVRKYLRAAGFGQIIDRWTLRRRDHRGWRGALISAAAANRAVKLLGDIAVEGMEYLAIKGHNTSDP